MSGAIGMLLAMRARRAWKLTDQNALFKRMFPARKLDRLAYSDSPFWKMIRRRAWTSFAALALACSSDPGEPEPAADAGLTVEAAPDSPSEIEPTGAYGEPCSDWWDCAAVSEASMGAQLGQMVACAADPQGRRYCTISCYAQTEAEREKRRALCVSLGAWGCTPEHACGWPK